VADWHNSTQCATEQATHYLFLLFSKKRIRENLPGSVNMQCDCALWLKSKITVSKKRGSKAAKEMRRGDVEWTQRRNWLCPNKNEDR